MTGRFHPLERWREESVPPAEPPGEEEAIVLGLEAERALAGESGG